MTDYELQLKTAALRRAMCWIGGALCLFLFCSCAVTPPSTGTSSPTVFPGEVTLAPEAGRGGHLIVKLRLESGEELPMILDTGAPGTALDKSLEPKLGRRRGTMPVRLAGQRSQPCGIYETPELFLGGVPLVTGPIVAAYDFNRQPMGILGMDCLKHYCLQLDFQAGKLRFLNPNTINPAELGQAFPLAFEGNYPCIRKSNLAGQSQKPLLVDVGCNIDGLVDRGSNHLAGIYLPECQWAGGSYSNLTVGAVEHGNALGLRFLARHLVTFDFPRKTLYLRQSSVGPLDQGAEPDLTASPRRSALKFLTSLLAAQRLPGWSKGGKEHIYFDEKTAFDGNAVTFTFWATGASARHHYQVNRPAQVEAWKLSRAWRSDQNGSPLEEYPVP